MFLKAIMKWVCERLQSHVQPTYRFSKLSPSKEKGYNISLSDTLDMLLSKYIMGITLYSEYISVRLC